MAVKPARWLLRCCDSCFWLLPEKKKRCLRVSDSVFFYVCCLGSVLLFYLAAAAWSCANVIDFGLTIGDPAMRWKSICDPMPIALETPNMTV